MLRFVIVRQLTAPGPGGVAVLELSGAGVREALAALWPAALGAPRGGPRLARLECAGELLDEALVWIESEQRVELHLHGSPPVVARVLAALSARVAAADTEPSILEQRAWELLPHAASEAGARILLDQRDGALRRELEALCAVADDEAAATSLASLLEAGRVARFALVPTRVVLVGPVNAGKSTLFNALVGAQRAIVSPAPGATRDVLSERAQLGEWPIQALDTAGERSVPLDAVGGELEARGQQLARESSAEADWIVRLWAADAELPPPAASRPPREVWVASRADLCVGGAPGGCDAYVSAVRDPRDAVAQLTRLFVRDHALPARAWRAGTAAPFDGSSRRALELARSLLDARARNWREPLLEALRR